MIPRECKRLAEVDFPIAEVSKHAAWEKSIRHGHPKYASSVADAGFPVSISGRGVSFISYIHCIHQSEFSRQRLENLRWAASPRTFHFLGLCKC